MLSARKERRQAKQRAANQQFAERFTEAVAYTGLLGPTESHVRGGHDQLIDPKCSLCQSHGIPEHGPQLGLAA